MFFTALHSSGAMLARAALTAFASASTHPGFNHSTRAPSDHHIRRTPPSEHGLYRASIMPEGDSIPQGRLQKWTLHLDAANGAPVSAASVAIDGGMPQHGHGLPTKPRVTRELGNGDYLVEGMKFNMGGWWVVKFHVDSQTGSDSAVFNLSL